MTTKTKKRSSSIQSMRVTENGRILARIVRAGASRSMAYDVILTPSDDDIWTGAVVIGDAFDPAVNVEADVRRGEIRMGNIVIKGLPLNDMRELAETIQPDLDSDEATLESPEFDTILTSLITVDPRYQRELKPRHIQKIIDNFNPRQLGILEVSRRGDGSYAVFDGQHRLAALRALGHRKAPCLVHRNLRPAHEAALFVRLQLDRKSPTPVERFKAQLFAGDKEAKAIHKIVTEAGLVVGHAPGQLRSIVAVERVHRKMGADCLRAALEQINYLWGDEKRATDGQMIGGMALFLNAYSDALTDRHIEKLLAVSPTVIIRRAAGAGGAGGSGAANYIADELRKTAGVRKRGGVA